MLNLKKNPLIEKLIPADNKYNQYRFTPIQNRQIEVTSIRLQLLKVKSANKPPPSLQKSIRIKIANHFAMPGKSSHLCYITSTNESLLPNIQPSISPSIHHFQRHQNPPAHPNCGIGTFWHQGLRRSTGNSLLQYTGGKNGGRPGTKKNIC